MLHSAEESKNYAEQLREDNNTIAIIDCFAFSMLSDCSYVVPCAAFPDSAPVFFRRRMSATVHRNACFSICPADTGYDSIDHYVHNHIFHHHPY